MSGFAVLDYESDSSVDMDEGNCESEIDLTPMNSPKRHSIPCLTLGQEKGMDIENSDFEIVTPRNSPKRKPMKHPYFKDLKFHYWKGPEDNNLFPKEQERNNARNIPPLVLPDPSVSWADFQENIEKTPGTEEWFLHQARQKRIKEEGEKEERKRIERLMKLESEKKKREQERKRLESLSIKLAGELYSSTSAIVKERDNICKKNKPFFYQENSNRQDYFTLPQKDQDFFWDLIEYHPKAEEKKSIIQAFVYGECVFPKKGKVSGLLVLQKDGSLDTFSQQKPIKAIAEIFRRRGLAEPDTMQNKKTFQKNYNYNNNNRNYNYNNNKTRFY
jgi:hypothetical protein